MRRIIAIIGLIGAGKEVAACHIAEKYGYRIFFMGTYGIIGEIVKKAGLEFTRENLQNTAMNYRAKYGMEYFAKLLIEKIEKEDCKKAVISEIRRPEEIEAFRNHFGKSFFLIFVEASEKERFERLKKRGLERDPKTWEEFQKQENREFELYPALLMKLEDYRIENNRTIKKFEEKLDKLLKDKGLV